MIKCRMNGFAHRDQGMFLTKQPYKSGCVLIAIDFNESNKPISLGYRIIKKSNVNFSNIGIAKELHNKMTGKKFKNRLIKTLFARHLNMNAHRLIRSIKNENNTR